MKIYLNKNICAGREILGSRYFDDGPYYEKDFNVWFGTPPVTEYTDYSTTPPTEVKIKELKSNTHFSIEEVKSLFDPDTLFNVWMKVNEKALQDPLGIVELEIEVKNK